MKQREPIWWIPLARRVAVWGALSGFCVGTFFFVLSLFIVFSNSYGLRQMGISGGLCEAARIAAIVAVPACGVSLVIGWTSGLCAPAREPKNPFQSRFFRAVVADTLKFWLLFLFVVLLIAAFASIAFEPWLIRFGWETSIYGATVVLLIVSLWRAINRALRAVKEANCV